MRLAIDYVTQNRAHRKLSWLAAKNGFDDGGVYRNTSYITQTLRVRLDGSGALCRPRENSESRTSG